MADLDTFFFFCCTEYIEVGRVVNVFHARRLWCFLITEFFVFSFFPGQV